ncbi:heme ABC transporter ATP-binding protein [Elioraea sp.]|uniref:heme ABC transporter ATP-binding protein n=1 Tax=Elioraea sp. TaxID=2185103 RepID=UPI00307FAD2C
MIVARGVVVRRGGRVILEVPALEVTGGVLLGLVGPNGAGKSTLVRVLSGELAPDFGTVTWEDTEIARIAPAALARRRAVLPQASVLGFPLRAEAVVRLGRIPHAGRATRAEDARAVAAAMRLAGVETLAQRIVQGLSGGEAQRVQLARVLAQLHGTPTERTALFLDEPTSSLDLAHAHAILRVAAERARGGGIVVAVLHDLAAASRWCDIVAVMEGGRIVAHGTPEAVLDEATVGRVWAVPVRRVRVADGRDMVFLPR